MAPPLVDISVYILVTTNNAILVRDGDDTEAWLPKSQIRYDETGATGPGPYNVTVPEWLAIDKGLG